MKRISLLLSFCLLAACGQSGGGSSSGDNNNGLPPQVESRAQECPDLSGNYQAVSNSWSDKRPTAKVTRDRRTGFLNLSFNNGSRVYTDGQTRAFDNGLQIVASCSQGKVLMKAKGASSDQTIDWTIRKTGTGMMMYLTVGGETNYVAYKRIR